MDIEMGVERQGESEHMKYESEDDLSQVNEGTQPRGSSFLDSFSFKALSI